jgi:LysM repeat protein
MFGVGKMMSMLKKKKMFVVLILIVTISIVSFYNYPNFSYAKSNYDVLSVTVNKGDTLWSIANQYSHEAGISIQEYIYEIRKMNNLKSVTIHPGQSLQVLIANKSS